MARVLVLPPIAPGERAPLLEPLTPMERAVVELLADGNGGVGMNYPEIGLHLGTKADAPRFHARNAARKVPSTLPAAERLRAWWRKAGWHILRPTEDQVAALLATRERATASIAADSTP